MPSRSIDAAVASASARNRARVSGLRAVAAAGHDQRAGAPGVAEAEMQRGEPAHGEAADMGPVDPGGVHDGGDIVGGPRLAVAGRIVRRVGGRVAARIVGQRPVAVREMPQLRLPGAQVAGEFVHEDDRRSRPRLLVIQAHRRHRWLHGAWLGSSSVSGRLRRPRPSFRPEQSAGLRSSLPRAKSKGNLVAGLQIPGVEIEPGFLHSLRSVEMTERSGQDVRICHETS